MNKPQRLHPVTILFTIISNLKDMVIPLLVYAGFNLFNRGGGQAVVWIAIGTGLVVSFILVHAVLRWYRQVYFVEQNEFRMERGAWLKKKIYIPVERIQSVDDVESIWHRLFGVVQVRIETASVQEEPEAILEAVSQSAANQLKQALIHRKRSQANLQERDPDLSIDDGREPEPPPLDKERLHFRHLLLTGLTSGRLGVVLALLGPALSIVDDFFQFNEGMVREAYLWATGFLSVGWLLFAILLFAWVISILSTLIQDYRFTISRDDTHLMIQRGLLERRRTLIPLRRIQAVHIVENVARQALGYVTLRIESAGYGAAEDQKLVAFPLLKRSQVPVFLERFLPEFAEVAHTSLKPVPQRVWKRMVLYPLSLPILVAAGLTWALPVWGLWGWLLVPLVLLYNHWRFRDAGWSVVRRVVAFRQRRLNRVTTWIPARAMQCRIRRHSPFSRRVGLATFHTTLASGNRYHSTWLDEEEVNHIVEQMDPEREGTSV